MRFPSARFRSRLVLVFGAIAALLGCGAEPGPVAKTAPAEDRLVVLSPGLGIVCQDLGLEDKIVGRHDWDLALGSSIPKVGDHLNIDYEALLAVRPTRVIIEAPSGGASAMLTELGATSGFDVAAYPMLTLDDIAHATDDLYLDLVVDGFGPDGLGVDPASMRMVDPDERLSRELPSARLARAWSRRGSGFADVGPVLLLAASDPPGAVGPGSFHHQILERIGGVPALADGSAWQEMDAESIIRLDPAGIVLIAPRGASDEPGDWSRSDVIEALGVIGMLDIRAVRGGRLAVIDDPYALTPSTAMAGFADRLAEVLEGWRGSE